MQNLIETLSKKYQVKNITAENLEDGIGVEVGLNFVNASGEFLTLTEAVEEQKLGTLKVTTGKFQAKSREDATAQCLKEAERASIKYAHVARIGSYGNGVYNVTIEYVK